ncbi:MAG TPA: bifunctional phosphopantothenoylcysteine decarboxylase/phosphopantothenate--cysteine ligase CoaBC [Chloroflexi bacterium]|nr:bifunctional phosphopantothenoylcysteine decarboxylase/phosphopantothenate--cysteine ligase CoaBC [Chloroflexota bacterium]
MILNGAHVVLGVTGGIACYKAVDLASKLVQAGATVDVIMTEGATQFVTPLPFQTITKRPVSIDMFQLLRDTDMAHISLSARADVLVIAPATANTIAKIVHGLADNLLTSTVLATTAPLVIAPAMDADMWANPVTAENVATLRRRGATIVGPGEGRLASGRIGAGRLVATEEILAAIRQTLGRNGPLAGLRVVISAGGTQEPLDPVRHVGNRSSGRMGYALAEAARDYGAQVTLVTAPTGLPPVYGVDTVPVRTAAEMHDAVIDRLDATDVLIMAAAVADYRPAHTAEHKIKKQDGELVLRLERTVDILAAVAKRRTGPADGKIIVGFAAETENLLENARDKLLRKRLDLLVANDVSASDSGFEVATNRVTLLTPDGAPDPLPLLPKEEVAERILDRVAALWRASHG